MMFETREGEQDARYRQRMALRDQSHLDHGTLIQ